MILKMVLNVPIHSKYHSKWIQVKLKRDLSCSVTQTNKRYKANNFCCFCRDKNSSTRKERPVYCYHNVHIQSWSPLTTHKINSRKALISKALNLPTELKTAVWTDHTETFGSEEPAIRLQTGTERAFQGKKSPHNEQHCSAIRVPENHQIQLVTI